MKPLLTIENLPVLQNRVYPKKSDAQNCDTGTVTLAQDEKTGIVVNKEFDPDKIVYNEHYDNEQSHSARFSDHMDEVAAILKKYIRNRKVLEIGCGKGVFLKRLREKGYNVTGVDPSYEGCDPFVVKKYFTKELGLQGDFIIMRHVLEHIHEPVNFLKSIAEANNHSGLIYIEVPDLNWIIKNNTWFDIFYEHVNYFTPSDFKRIFSDIRESGTFFGGQYQYVIADLSSLNDKLSPEEKDFNLSFKSLDRIVNHLNRYKPSKTAIWGAASKGIIAAIHLSKTGTDIDCLVDINPNKTGKFAPVTGIKIIGPEELKQHFQKDDLIIIANPNYSEEIKKMTGHRFTYLDL